MDAIAIRNELRYANSPDLDRRRKIVLFSVLGLLDFSIISLYQTGVIRRLPDIPYKLFDSNRVNASEDAYRFGVPDGPVSAVAYASAMVLASAGGTENAQRKPAFDVALGATVAAMR